MEERSQIKDIVNPAFSVAKDFGWKFWANTSLAYAHWHNPWKDGYYENPQTLFNDTTRTGFYYCAGQAKVELTDDKVKEWLIKVLDPTKNNNPIYNYFGECEVKLGGSYSTNLLSEGNKLLAELSSLNLTPEQEEQYKEDILARQTANEQMATQIQNQRDLLWDIYQKRKADETNYIKYLVPLIVKFGVTEGATYAWDGPGYFVASQGFAYYDLLYNTMNNFHTLTQDKRMVDQSMRLITGQIPYGYAQISLNTVGGFNLIRSKKPPQIAKADIGWVGKSFDLYKTQVPYVGYYELRSELDITITNTSDYATTYVSNFTYFHTTLTTGQDTFSVDGQQLILGPNETGTAVIKLNLGNDGLSPDVFSIGNLLILGVTDTGIYPVYNLPVPWVPYQIVPKSNHIISVSEAYKSTDLDDVQILPYPVSWGMASTTDSVDQTLYISIYNPLTMTVQTSLTQIIPVSFTIINDGGGTRIGDLLIWTDTISSCTGTDIQVILRRDSLPGTAEIIPGPTLVIRDPFAPTQEIFTTTSQLVDTSWPINVSPNPPYPWPVDELVTIPITITNLSPSLDIQGILTTTLRILDDSLIWQDVQSINIEKGGIQVITLQIDTPVESNYVILSGEMGIGSENKQAFWDSLPVEYKAEFSAIPVSGTPPLNINFMNESIGDYSISLWDFGDGITSTINSPTHTYTTTGSYTVTLKVSGILGEDVKEKVGYINVYEPIHADFSADQTNGPAPLEVLFTNETTGYFTFSLWDFGDGFTSTELSPTHTYTRDGVYTVTLTVSGPGGTDTKVRTNYITVYKSVQADFEGIPTEGSAPLQVSLTNLSRGDFSSSLWDFGDGITSTMNSPTHTYIISGVYTVTLTISGLGGTDIEVKPDYITVYEPVQADFSGTPTSGIAPLSVDFTNLSSGDFDTCFWNFGDGITSTLENPSTFIICQVYTR